VPSAAVVVPTREPFTITEAFGKGFPSASETLPVKTVFWAKAFSGKILIPIKMDNSVVLDNAENDISNRLLI
jgi:hypothetical protein